MPTDSTYPALVQVRQDGNLHLPSGTVAEFESGATQVFDDSTGNVPVVTKFAKNIASIADATATTVLTVTVPNSAQGCSLQLGILAALGAGGAVGAYEASAQARGAIVITRTPGLAAVATAGTLILANSAAVAGAATITLAYSVSAVVGANSATQTFNVQVTITRGSGTSTNHNCFLDVELLNAVGITVA